MGCSTTSDSATSRHSSRRSDRGWTANSSTLRHARKTDNAVVCRWFLIGGGVIYLVLWLYGLAINPQQPVNSVPLNMADNWLHLALAVGMLGLGLLLGSRPANAVR
ncbi:MAG TPA: DUF4383 domain-containing protein [Mycobacterium sp.]|nr:DUF4383 domain-containing protein [Mycobacterium sp.]